MSDRTDHFRSLVRTAPAALLASLDTMPVYDLTFAAEAIGELEDRGIAVGTLLGLLGHDDAVVREGAVYGLERLLDEPDVRERLVVVAREDLSPGVRAAAGGALEL